jgi:hypothetical protein
MGLQQLHSGNFQSLRKCVIGPRTLLKCKRKLVLFSVHRTVKKFKIHLRFGDTSCLYFLQRFVVTLTL